MKRFMVIPILLAGLFSCLSAIDLPVEPGELYINEIMASNSSYEDPFGEFDDWVEIFNPMNYAINLAGMYMTDSHYSGGVTAWTQIPSSNPTVTTIQPHSYLVMWFDENTAQGPLHINNKLGAAADAVYLIDSDGVTVVDSYTWTASSGLNATDVSIGRVPDGGASWQLFGFGQPYPATPGASNGEIVNSAPVITNLLYTPNPAVSTAQIIVSANVTDPDNNLQTVELLWSINDVAQNNLAMTAAGNVFSVSLGQHNDGDVITINVRATDALDIMAETGNYNITVGFIYHTLLINEIMPSNLITVTDEVGDYEDWVEIFNPNDFPVDLGGYFLVDSNIDNPDFVMVPITPYLPGETTIPALGYVLAWFDEEFIEGPFHINTRLSTTDDAVYLVAPDGLTIVDQKSWTIETGLTADVSLGRFPNGAESWTLFGGANILPVTPGTSNSPTGAEDDVLPGVIPTLSVYPNPAAGAINFTTSNLKATAQLVIYNLKGQLVREFILPAGTQTTWDRTDSRGRIQGNGIYFCRLKSGNHHLTEKLVLLK